MGLCYLAENLPLRPPPLRALIAAELRVGVNNKSELGRFQFRHHIMLLWHYISSLIGVLFRPRLTDRRG